MRVKLWGTRGSLAAPGPEPARYGGNTACIEIVGADGTVLILDAGTGLRRASPPLWRKRVDILLSHLHLDHIQGLGFFRPLYDPEVEVHIWGPASVTLGLRPRLSRYLSPPLFPVHLRSLPCRLNLHEVPCGEFAVGELRIETAFVCHPGPTVGYRIAEGESVLAYLPDHEPALGFVDFPRDPEWTSGYALAAGADLLIHDAQYTDDEYAARVGWGHSTLGHALAFARLAEVRHLVLFHHDPEHDDDDLDRLFAVGVEARRPLFEVTLAAEEAVFELVG